MIEFRISSRMIDAEISSTFSKREFEIRDPKFESKNLQQIQRV